nr:MAG TPA: hypothetical protein [Caudoviricetes sp.]
MKPTKTWRRILQSLNTAGVYPNVLQVASATGGGLSYGQTLYRYKVNNQLPTLELVCDKGPGRMYELKITADGLQALGGGRRRSGTPA